MLYYKLSPIRICEENPQADITEILNEFRVLLEDFDLKWTTFEQVFLSFCCQIKINSYM